MSEPILTIADVARRLGVSRQAIKNRLDRGTLPPPDFHTDRGAPAWRVSTLVEAKVI